MKKAAAATRGESDNGREAAGLRVISRSLFQYHTLLKTARSATNPPRNID